MWFFLTTILGWFVANSILMYIGMCLDEVYGEEKCKQVAGLLPGPVMGLCMGITLALSASTPILLAKIFTVSTEFKVAAMLFCMALTLNVCLAVGTLWANARGDDGGGGWGRGGDDEPDPDPTPPSWDWKAFDDLRSNWDTVDTRDLTSV